MKKILFIALVSFCITIFKTKAQVLKTTPSMGEKHAFAEWLLQKSKNQKTAAWILLGSGAGVAIAGGIIGTNAIKNSNPDDPFDIFPRGSLAGGAMVLIGAAAIVTSIPFFIASGRNKKKANLIFQNDPQSFLHQLHKANIFSVGISLRL